MPIEPQEARRALLDRLQPVGAESIPTNNPAALAGRVLAERVRLDRDSPALDVSAMDGFAVRLAELQAGPLPLAGECPIGEAPQTLDPRTIRRIFTGSPLPAGADTVVRIERATVEDGSVRLLDGSTVAAGDDIRRRGENARTGAVVLEPGRELTTAAVAAVATVGAAEVSVHRPLRVTVVTTGNELERGPGATDPWRLRDSNGPALVAMLAALPWVGSAAWRHGADELDELVRAFEMALAESDAVVFTGGVSKGDHDLVRPAVERAGGEVVFHRIAARPGQPTLGAVLGGKPVIGLPGNPQAVLCGGRRVLLPVLRGLAGFADPDPPVSLVSLTEWRGKRLPLTWWRPVKLVGPGVAEIAPSKGSGDLIGPAGSDGFVEAPPESDGVGPYAFYPWGG